MTPFLKVLRSNEYKCKTNIKGKNYPNKPL